MNKDFDRTGKSVTKRQTVSLVVCGGVCVVFSLIGMYWNISVLFRVSHGVLSGKLISNHQLNSDVLTISSSLALILHLALFLSSLAAISKKLEASLWITLILIAQQVILFGNGILWLVPHWGGAFGAVSGISFGSFFINLMVGLPIWIPVWFYFSIWRER